MRFAWLAIGGLIAACDPPGLTLEVTAFDLPVKRVELFVGEHCGTSCPDSVAPPGLTAKPTDIYLVTDEQTWFAPVVEGKAGFRLWADDDRTVPIIVAVGFDAADGGNPIAAATTVNALIRAHDSEYWQLPLAMAAEIIETPATSGNRVKLWRRPDKLYPACVMVEDWRSGVAARD